MNVQSCQDLASNMEQTISSHNQQPALDIFLLTSTFNFFSKYSQETGVYEEVWGGGELICIQILEEESDKSLWRWWEA